MILVKVVHCYSYDYAIRGNWVLEIATSIATGDFMNVLEGRLTHGELYGAASGLNVPVWVVEIPDSNSGTWIFS
jgi:hypothetical protein